MSAPAGGLPLGVALGWQVHPFPALLRLVRRAEALGYAAAFVDGDVSQLGGDSPRDALDGWTTTMALLARTERIEIGSIRLVHHWNAARLAQSAATAAALFPGRFRFLISIGGHPVDRAFGLDFPEVRERVRWLDETLSALRALWRGERVTVAGERVRLDGAVVRPLPPPDTLRIAVAARAPSLLGVVARHADVWDMNLPPIPALVHEAEASLTAACAREGRDPAGIARQMWVFTRTGQAAADDPRVRAEFRRLNPWFAAVPDAELTHGIVAGPPEACRSRLESLRTQLRIALPIVDLSGVPEGDAMRHIEALAPSRSAVEVRPDRAKLR